LILLILLLILLLIIQQIILHLHHKFYNTDKGVYNFVLQNHLNRSNIHEIFSFNLDYAHKDKKRWIKK